MARAEGHAVRAGTGRVVLHGHTEELEDRVANKTHVSARRTELREGREAEGMLLNVADEERENVRGRSTKARYPRQLV